jgi:hypothetical protein
MGRALTCCLCNSMHSGHASAKPGHLLLAVSRMTPLPTILHNPVTWVISRAPGLIRGAYHTSWSKR